MLRQLFFPNGLLVLCAILALTFILPGREYPAGARLLCAGVLFSTSLLAVRLHSLRACLATISLSALLLWMVFGPSAAGALRCGMALMIVDLAAIALLAEDTFFDWDAVLWWTAFLGVQWTTFIAVSYWVPDWIQSASTQRFDTSFGELGVLESGVLFCLALLLVKFCIRPEAVGAGFVWAAIVLLMRRPAAGEIYIGLAGFALAVAVIERSHWIAYHDELTGLPGRRAFNEALAGLGETYSIAMVDVDHFKNFNDTFGHDTGDQVLRNVAGHLARVTGGGKAYRCGGEEFAVLYPGIDVDDAIDLAEKLRRAIEEDVFVARGPSRSTRKRPERRLSCRVSRKRKAAVETHVTVSIGVAAAQRDTHDAHEVIKAADRALYSAKDLGRNRVEAAPEEPKPRRSRSAQSEVSAEQ
jgi:diguanylate cyclase (GGDEF)-like protein